MIYNLIRHLIFDTIDWAYIPKQGNLMNRISSTSIVTASLLLCLAACSSDDDDDDADITSSEISEEAPGSLNTGEPGGDITPIAGLWDGSETVDGVTDVVYWNFAADGVLTRYDYQQDGVADASGENCYLVGDPTTVSPEDEDTYSLSNVAITAVRTDDTLDIIFLDADVNDFDADGDTAETPTLSWTLLTTPGLDDLNSCTAEIEGTDAPQDNPQTAIDNETEIEGDLPDNGLPTDDIADRPLLTRAECTADGGTIVGDIGDGSINDPDFLCPSGLPPLADISFLEGEPIATEGEVCCPA